ncbi:hypothetical protein M9Y10_039087 [Tritrichomonas musculus]|uniref:DUF3447 domain-containing protein n=1 Tax=Tritrichomonas musculus TaxID=1915356 RepID=A0ABR2KAV4_9EUKA
MKYVFEDQSSIKLYARIQKRLSSLKPNSRKKSIDKVFEIIPPEFLEEKEKLTMICQLFAKLARTTFNMGKVVIQLFERIMDQIKKYLQDESSLFWNIFGGIMYFKLWMFEEGLISVEKIILSAQLEKTPAIAEYFLPEIIDNEPDFFYKEIKYKFPIFSNEDSYSKETIEKTKLLRKKHFQWIKESGDRHDPSYLEIETNPLRLAIKLDDVDIFQALLSQSNLSINSNIQESVVEQFVIDQHEYRLIEYAAEYNSINIFKFLLMNDAELKPSLISSAIFSCNYEIIHIVETKLTQEFEKSSLLNAIASWNQKVARYVTSNYNFDYLYERESKNENEDNNNESKILTIINETFYSLNFRFLKSTLLPFFRHNPSFVQRNIHNILFKTFSDMSGYLTLEILKHPEIDVNYISKRSKKSFLFAACQKNNLKAVEILLKYANIDVNCLVMFGFSPLFYSCAFFCDTKILKMLCNHPKIEINAQDERDGLTAFQMALSRGNAYAVKYLTENYNDIEEEAHFSELASFCLSKRHLMSAKYLVKFFSENCQKDNFSQLIENSRKYLRSQIQSDYSDEFDQIVEEVEKENN